MRWLLLVGLVVPSLAFGFYSPKVARWTTPDPIGDAGGKNLYAFCENDPVNKFDPNGCAYFAYRMLDSDFASGFGIIRMGLENFNWAVAHEQLIFEDGGDPINIGYFEDSMRKRDQFNFQNQYEPLPGHYDDCVMREAVARANFQCNSTDFCVSA